MAYSRATRDSLKTLLFTLTRRPMTLISSWKLGRGRFPVGRNTVSMPIAFPFPFRHCSVSFSSVSSHAVCAHCKSPVAAQKNTDLYKVSIATCSKCGTMHLPDTNYFDLMVPITELIVDGKYTMQPSMDQLKKRYFALQSQCHPDRLSSSSWNGGPESISIWINKAYQCLKDPISRARYILETFHGIRWKETDQVQEIQPPHLLMKLMEIHEQLDEMENFPTEKAITSLSRLKNDIASQQKERVQSISNLIQKKSPLPTILSLLNEWNYFQTCVERLDTLLESKSSHHSIHPNKS